MPRTARLLRSLRFSFSCGLALAAAKSLVGRGIGSIRLWSPVGLDLLRVGILVEYATALRIVI